MIADESVIHLWDQVRELTAITYRQFGQLYQCGGMDAWGMALLDDSHVISLLKTPGLLPKRGDELTTTGASGYDITGRTYWTVTSVVDHGITWHLQVAFGFKEVTK